MLHTQARHTKPVDHAARARQTFTGNRVTDLEEPLLFESGRAEVTGTDADEPATAKTRLGSLERTEPIGLPGLSEPEAIRHYVRLSRMNAAIDANTYPLGSCTMKHNPRLNEKMARLPGFGDIHPLQPQSTVQGALALIDGLAKNLLDLTNMSAVAMSPKAGAHGELCGMMAIKAAIIARGEEAARRIVLVPDSAHGTNPATAALLGFEVKSVPADADGDVHLDAAKALIGPDVAAIMLTNPNTCGLFERDIVEIARAVHEAGGYFYCDGANFNAIVGKVRPGDLGVDAMHINLHKTFSTPHGGGGPGAGPVVLSAELAAHAPTPWLVHRYGAFDLLEHMEGEAAGAFGRMSAFHPMTMYFPLVVHGAMLIEPTETESKRELDRFCDTLLELAASAKAGDRDRFVGAPFHAPLRRLDETLAARRPKLRWVGDAA